jgi:NAD(P)-dependent dehydrogenase (short-subunit alcohol dehydrogenase family)
MTSADMTADIARIASGRMVGDVAIVTGAGRGIGKQIALEFAREGAAVALVARSRDQLAEAAAEIAALGGRALVLPVDVLDLQAVEAAVAETTARFGRVTVLVNNAGTDRPFGPVSVADPDEWWHAQKVHVRGPLYFMRSCLPAMQEAGRGRIINMSSAAATMVGANTSAYCVAKATLGRLTEHVDLENRSYGVRAFATHPGTIVTDMMRNSLSDPEARKWAPEMIAYLETFRDVDTTPELVRLGKQMVAIACGDHDDAAGRYIDLDTELRPVD